MKRLSSLLPAVLLLAACGGAEREEEGAFSGANEMAAAPGNAVEGESPTDAPSPQPSRSVGPPDSNSVYTSLSDCDTVETYEDGGGFLKRCEGHAGYDLEYRQSDLRENLVLIDPEGERTELRLTELVARGAFNDLGPTVEWRGENVAREPRVLIVRMNVAQPDPMSADESLLAIVRLADPACLVATVPPGPGQNVAARKLARRDQLPACVGG